MLTPSGFCILSSMVILVTVLFLVFSRMDWYLNLFPRYRDRIDELQGFQVAISLAIIILMAFLTRQP